MYLLAENIVLKSCTWKSEWNTLLLELSVSYLPDENGAPGLHLHPYVKTRTRQVSLSGFKIHKRSFRPVWRRSLQKSEVSKQNKKKKVKSFFIIIIIKASLIKRYYKKSFEKKWHSSSSIHSQCVLEARRLARRSCIDEFWAPMRWTARLMHAAVHHGPITSDLSKTSSIRTTKKNFRWLSLENFNIDNDVIQININTIIKDKITIT